MGDDEASESATIKETILQLTGARIQPSLMLVNAFAEVFFEHIYPLHPIVDRDDLVIYSDSTLLVQSLCLIGSSFGHPRDSQDQIKTSEPFYQKVKTLLDLGYERNNLVVLKVLCMLTCRSVRQPTRIDFHNTWHWLGLALRYVIHMGLHKQATYARRKAAGSCRRLWWHLYVLSIPFGPLPPLIDR